MGLKDFRLPTRTVSYGDGDFQVKGLGFAEIAPIVREHGPALALLFASGRQLADEQPDKGLAAMDLTTLGTLALDQAPELVSAIIATAVVEAGMDYREKRAITDLLPAPTQFEAIFAIFELTLVTEGGLGKTVEMVTRMMEQVTSGITTLTKTI